MEYKKIVYNTGEFNIDALKKGIEMAMGDKLNDPEWCKQMEEEQKNRINKYNMTYYNTPTEDLYIGYECEIQTSWGYVAGKWPDILKADTHVALFGGGATLRSKWLTKEQIEESGWKPDGFSYAGWEYWLGEHAEWKLCYNTWEIEDVDRIWENQVLITKKGQTHYCGEIKSVNELRVIMKMLHIK